MKVGKLAILGKFIEMYNESTKLGSTSEQSVKTY